MTVEFVLARRESLASRAAASENAVTARFRTAFAKCPSTWMGPASSPSPSSLRASSISTLVTRSPPTMLVCGSVLAPRMRLTVVPALAAPATMSNALGSASRLNVIRSSLSKGGYAGRGEGRGHGCSPSIPRASYAALGERSRGRATGERGPLTGERDLEQRVDRWLRLEQRPAERQREAAVIDAGQGHDTRSGEP